MGNRHRGKLDGLGVESPKKTGQLTLWTGLHDLSMT
jgi:hypothetical protein